MRWGLSVAILIAACVEVSAQPQRFFRVTDKTTIQVSGDAAITAEPDRARLSMSVTEEGPVVVGAKQTVDRKVKRIQEVLLELGVGRSRINTSMIRVHRIPDRRPRAGSPEPGNERYRVTRDVRVTVTDIEKLDRIMERSVDLGTNQIWNVHRYSSKQDSLERVAMKRAAENAREDATLLAETLGRAIGGLLMAEHEFGNVSGPVYTFASEARGRGNQPFARGTIEIRAQVNVVYEVE